MSQTVPLIELFPDGRNSIWKTETVAGQLPAFVPKGKDRNQGTPEQKQSPDSSWQPANLELKKSNSWRAGNLTGVLPSFSAPTE
jgi:hypothetical protein